MKVITPSKSRSNGPPETTKSIKPGKTVVHISKPKMETAVFEIKGTSPLVVHRFSKKTKDKIIAEMMGICTSVKGTKREPLNPEAEYNSARYISPDGWDGFNASAIRCAMISACRICGFPMTKAKLALFVVEDGRDRDEPQYSLIRIYGKPRMAQDFGRLDNGSVCPIHRPCYDEWSAKIRIRFDAELFTLTDVSSLLMRVGIQVGIGEGRHDSRKSSGMGWGCFEVVEDA